MRFEFMRFLDKYIGVLLIAFLVVLQALKFPFRRPLRLDDGETPKRILIQKFFGIGSLVNTVPLVTELRKQYPNVRIIFMTFKSNAAFLELFNIADRVIVIDDSRFLPFVKTTLKALHRCNQLKLDICIDLEFFSKYSMIMSFLSRSPIRTGFFAHFNLRSHLLTHPTSFNHYKHISRAYLSMAEVLGVELSTEDCHLCLPPCTDNEKRNLWDSLGQDPINNFIVINPNASALCNLRKWPAEKYARLITQLLTKYPAYTIMLIGAPSEQSYVQSLYEQCSSHQNRIINAAGKTSCKDLLVILEICSALISNDSGPVHLAAGYATPTIGIYGPETPVLYGPCNANAISLYKELYCSPCINVLDNKSYTSCEKVTCVNAISETDVMDALETLLVLRESL